MSTEELIETVMRLPPAEREAFLDRLGQRLDAEAGGAEVPVWTPELERRAREALRGENLVDAEVVYADLEAELRGLHARR